MFYLSFQNEAAFDEVFQLANFNTFIFHNRVKMETYNVSTNRSTVVIIFVQNQIYKVEWLDMITQ